MKGRIISTILTFCLLIGLSASAIADSNSFEMNLILDKTSYSQGDTVIVVGNVTNNNLPYADADVIMVIQSKFSNIKLFTYQIQTDENGEYSKSFSLNNDIELGAYVVIVNAVGLSKSEDFTVSSSNKQSSLSLDKDVYYRGEEVKISGTAYSNDVPQSDTSVVIKVLRGVEIMSVYDLITDSEGKFNATYHLSDSQKLGNYKVEANLLNTTLTQDFEVKEVVIQPTVESIDPEDNKTSVNVNAKVTVMFNKDIDISTLTDENISIAKKISGEKADITIDYNDKVLTLDPTRNLSYSTTYEVKLTNLMDDSGNMMDEFKSTFTTQSKPYVPPVVPPSPDYDDEDDTSQEFYVIVNLSQYGHEPFEIKVSNVGLDQQLGDDNIDRVIINLEDKGYYDEMSITMSDDFISLVIEKNRIIEINSDDSVIELDSSNIEIEDEDKIKLIVRKSTESETEDLISKLETEEYTLTSSILEYSVVVIKDDASEEDLQSTPINLTTSFDISKASNYEKVGMYFYNEEEKWEYVGGKTSEDGKIAFQAREFGKYSAMEYDKKFDDVNISWANNAIEVLASRHIINGVDKSNYAPNKAITRSAFSKLLVEALNLKKGEMEIEFEDVEDGKWYTEYVEIVASLGIVTGFDGKFDPDVEISRESMATMLIRALKIYNPDGNYSATELNYDDETLISDWAKESVATATSKGLLSGVGDNRFAPKATATRAESSVVIYRLLKLLELL